jgi:hypothetical protein
MNSRWIVAITMLVSIITAHAQPDSLWSRTYGGIDNETCKSVQQTTDGGYILAGYIESSPPSDMDIWLIKTDANGDSLWSRTFGGDNRDECLFFHQTLDGGYAFGGATESFGAGDWDFWLVKTDANGDSLWSKTYGGVNSERCYSLLQTTDEGYLLAGYTDSFGAGNDDIWLLRTNANGDSLWSRTFGGSQDDVCASLHQTLDGGYVLVGSTESYGSGEGDIWLVKADTNGDSLWSRTFGGGSDETGYQVQQTPDSGYFIAGATRSFGSGWFDAWIVKTDASGDSIWSRTFGGSEADFLPAMRQTMDGGYVLAGMSFSFRIGLSNFWAVKTNVDGDSLWSLILGGSSSDACFSVQQSSDGSFMLAGGSYSYGAGHSDFWIVKTGPDPVDAVDKGFTPLPEATDLSAYPNPFNSELTLTVTGFGRDVRISLHNLLGQEVDVIHDGVLADNRIHYSAPADLASGLYFVRAKDERHVLTEKVVLMK